MRAGKGPREAVMAVPALTVALTILDPPSSRKVAVHVACGDLILMRVRGVLSAAGAADVPISIFSGLSLGTSDRTHASGLVVDASESCDFYIDPRQSLVPDSNVLWIETGAVSGSPDQVHLTFEYATNC